jgi:hypothetical protein
MVVEVTSSLPGRDLDAKRHACAGARVPLHLLADRQARTVTLLTTPQRDDYVGRFVVPVGDKLELPAPFSFASPSRWTPRASPTSSRPQAGAVATRADTSMADAEQQPHHMHHMHHMHRHYQPGLVTLGTTAPPARLAGDHVVAARLLGEF